MTQLNLSFGQSQKVQLVRQTEVAECGFACLAMIASFHGMQVDLATLRRSFGVSMRGAPLKIIMTTADMIGFNSRALKLPLEEIENLTLPAILHWDLSHYVVVERFRNGRALIHDPAGSSQWMSRLELSQHFTGVALELVPTNNFEIGERRETLKIAQLWSRVTGFKRALLQTLLLSLILQAFALASPYYMQIAIDSVIPAQDADLLLILAWGFGLFTLINVAAFVLRGWVVLNAGTMLSFGISSNITRRLFRLPIEWFASRHAGDILSRFQSIAPIQSMLTVGGVAAALDGVMAVFTLLIMFFYSPALSLLAAVAFILYVLVRLLTFPAQRAAQENTIVTAARAQSLIIETLRGITTLRLYGKEMERHALWQTKSIDAANSNIRLSRLEIWQNAANSLIFGIETVLSIWIAVSTVIGGGLSVGMVFAYLAYKAQFLARAGSLVDQAIAFRMLSLHLDRLADIALTTEDVGFRSNVKISDKPSGRIELRNIRYRYSPADPLVLSGINLTVEAGDHIAITGPSGGGKSTLLKIVLGLVEPEEGEILIDGQPLSQFGHINYRSGVGAVSQDDCLFAGSLKDNIAIFDDAPVHEEIIVAAKLAAIHDDIIAMPMQYDTLVGDMGSAVSSGQKQRILLARALYRKPRILVLDEATSHLDQELELVVTKAIDQLKLTRIVAAHRTATLKSARVVYHLENGELSKL